MHEFFSMHCLSTSFALTLAILSVFHWVPAQAVGAAPKSTLAVAPAPAGVEPNPDYRLRVRVPNGEWKEVFIYRVLVVKEFRSNEQGHDNHLASAASVAMFDFTGTVEVEVNVDYAPLQSCTVRPIAREVTGRIDGSAIRFTLDRPAKLVIAANGDKARELHLFAGEPEHGAPTRGGRNVTYFGPGVHQLDPFEYKVKSNETIYLAPGAVVRGQFTCDHVENVVIRGRGVIDQTDRFTPGGRKGSNGVRIDFGRNITIEGITILDAVGYHIGLGSSHDVRIRNTRSFSVSQWADGIDAMSCTGVKIDDVFIRSSDDCIAFYGGRWMFAGDGRDISVTNSTFWADVAHPIFMGIHGTPGKAETLSNITFKNIDILEHNQPGPGYQGCMTINAGDGILVKDVTFEDIRVEPFTLGQLINLRVFQNGAYNTEPGRGVQGITFKNISFTGVSLPRSEISGFASDRAVHGVVFENLTINGKRAKNPAEAGIEVGQHASDIQFR